MTMEFRLLLLTALLPGFASGTIAAASGRRLRTLAAFTALWLGVLLWPL